MAKILVCADGFFRAFSAFGLEPYIDSFIKSLARNGNDVLTYIAQDFQVRHKLKRKFINYQTKKEIRNFNPDLIIAFNNAIKTGFVKHLTCPILVVASDTPVYWNYKSFIKKNSHRYSVAYLNNDMADTLCEEYNIPMERQILIPYSTDMHADSKIKQTKDIAFIGNFYNSETYLSNIFLTLKNKSKDKELCQKLFIKFIDELEKSKKVTKTAVKLIEKLESVANMKINYDYLISSVFGTLTEKKRINLLSGLLDMDLHIWSWDGGLSCVLHYPELFKKCEVEQVYSVEDNERVYNSSRISLNLPHAQVNTGFSWRVCDILASNALLISNPSKDLERLFGGIIPTYKDANELREKVIYYLNHDKERREIVAKCHEIINKNHRYENVFKVIGDYYNMSLINNTDGKLQFLKRTIRKQNEYLQKHKND